MLTSKLFILPPLFNLRHVPPVTACSAAPPIPPTDRHFVCVTNIFMYACIMFSISPVITWTQNLSYTGDCEFVWSYSGYIFKSELLGIVAVGPYRILKSQPAASKSWRVLWFVNSRARSGVKEVPVCPLFLWCIDCGIEGRINSDHLFDSHCICCSDVSWFYSGYWRNLRHVQTWW